MKVPEGAEGSIDASHETGEGGGVAVAAAFANLPLAVWAIASQVKSSWSMRTCP